MHPYRKDQVVTTLSHARTAIFLYHVLTTLWQGCGMVGTRLWQYKVVAWLVQALLS